MNIGDLIDEVDTIWAPNSFTTAQKCKWLTEDQREVFRKISFPNQSVIIKTTADLSLYPLPSNCPADRVRQIVLVEDEDTSTEYQYADMGEEAKGYFFTIVNDTNVLLYPAPEEDDLDIYIYYAPQPGEFSASNLAVEPSLPEDYHTYLKWKLAAKCAKGVAAGSGSDADYIKANNYENEAAKVLADMQMDFSHTPAGGFVVRMVW